jgi:predicted nuclease with TOPRIM domain
MLPLRQNWPKLVNSPSSTLVTHVERQLPLGHDVERSPGLSSVTQPDPFMFRVGLKTDEEIAEMRRRRKTGKGLARYQQKQNDVGQCHLFIAREKLIAFAAHCLSAETHG